MQLRHVSTNLRQNLRRNLSMHAAVIITLFVSLTMGGVGVLLNRQAELTTDVIGSELQVSVFLCTAGESEFPQCTSEVTAEQEAAVLDTIETNPEVESTDVVSKAEGLDNLRELDLVPDSQLEGPDAIITEENIPKEVRITLKDPEQYEGVVSAVQDLDGVRNIRLAKDLVGDVFTILDAIKYAAWGAALALVLAAVMLVANTIRLTALARRREIEIMRLVGASRVFIVAPFVLEAVVTALIGVALSIGALAAFVRFAVIGGIDEIFDGTLPFVGWSDLVYTVVLIAIAGPVLTVVPTLLMTRKYLRF